MYEKTPNSVVSASVARDCLYIYRMWYGHLDIKQS